MMKEKPTELDLIYIAGFFDGEGSVTIHENGHPSPRGKVPNHTLQVSVGNTDPRIVEQLKLWFGGSFTIRYCNKPNHRNVAQWTIRTKGAGQFLKAIYPYVRMKTKQIEIAIKFQNSKAMRGPKPVSPMVVQWREVQRWKIRKLNDKHWIKTRSSNEVCNAET